VVNRRGGCRRMHHTAPPFAENYYIQTKKIVQRYT
jgi:hypothetical protein